MAQFRWHTKQVTSIEWAFDDENVLTVGSADDTVRAGRVALSSERARRVESPTLPPVPSSLLQVTLWDMSLEGDDDGEPRRLRLRAPPAQKPCTPSLHASVQPRWPWLRLQQPAARREGWRRRHRLSPRPGTPAWRASPRSSSSSTPARRT